MNLQIVKASLEDIPTLNSISLASKKHWGYPQEWIDHWRDDLKVTPEHFEENVVLKAILKKNRPEETIIGFCIIDETTDQYEVLHLWLDPPYIGKGYGKVLLNQSLEMVIHESKPIMIEADPYAEPFYAKMGFVTIGEVKSSYPEGRVLPLMRREMK